MNISRWRSALPKYLPSVTTWLVRFSLASVVWFWLGFYRAVSAQDASSVVSLGAPVVADTQRFAAAALPLLAAGVVLGLVGFVAYSVWQTIVKSGQD